MIKLIKLELKRNNLRTYLAASAITCVILLAAIYFIAYMGQIEDSPSREMEFKNYTNIFLMTWTISFVVFCTMSAIMYSRLIIGEYTGKRAALLFSYPVSRSKILLAKILLVFVFTSVSMLICTAIPYIVFSITESISPIVMQDAMTIGLAAEALITLGITVLALGAIGIVSLRIGFIKKSVPTTLISAILLSAVYANSLIGIIRGNNTIHVNGILSNAVISSIAFIIAIVTAAELSNKVNKMEAA